MQTGFILLLLMWKMFTFTIVWKSVTATLQSSGFSVNRGSSVKAFLCFGTHGNLSSPSDNDNAWNTLVLQSGMFWVGMDICPHSCSIKEKKAKREKHCNTAVPYCCSPQLFHHQTLQCSLDNDLESVNTLQHREIRLCCLTVLVYNNMSCCCPFVHSHDLSNAFISCEQWSPECQHWMVLLSDSAKYLSSPDTSVLVLQEYRA